MNYAFIHVSDIHYRKDAPEGASTIMKAFLEDLAQVRQQGYALDQQEATVGIHCIAAPIFNRKAEAIGTLNISGFTDQLPKKDFEKNGVLVKNAADRISRKLGYEG